MTPAALLVLASAGTFWTVVIIVVVLLVLGVLIFDGDWNWFDD